MTRRLSSSLLVSVLVGAALAGGASPAAAARAPFPETIPLAAGSAPEGIAKGPGTTFFAGARANGAIYRGNVRTGTRRLLVPGRTGRVAVGMQYDRATGRLWVAGSLTAAGRTTATVTAYNARTGSRVARFEVPGTRFLNDVQVTPRGVYVTDSLNAELVKVELNRHRSPNGLRILPLTGDWVQGTGFGANGIRRLPGGDLIITNSSTGKLYRVAPRTGVATEIAQRGTPLVSGDGLVLRGHTLYVINGFGGNGNAIAVVRLGAGARTATVVRSITDPDLDRGTTGALIAGALYVVNGRFLTVPTPTATTRYSIARVQVRQG